MHTVALELLDARGFAALYEECPPGRARELIDRALGASDECRGEVALDDRGAPAGIVLRGFVAGARGTGALLLVFVRAAARRRGIGRALVDRALATLHAEGARLVVAELREDDTAQAAIALLSGAGFTRENDVPDLFADDVPLGIWVRR